MKYEPHTLVRIREMILQGELPSGQRIGEAQLAERLGVSRTPVRQALPVLAREGLLVGVGARGYAVRAFTTLEIEQGVDLRGALEGFAARVLAERGVSQETAASFRAILAEGDVIFEKGFIVEGDEQAYALMNQRFHAAIVSAANTNIVQELLHCVNCIPFVGPEMIAFNKLNPKQMYDDLYYAQKQHYAIVDAIEFGEGARAEALFREHVHTQKHSMNLRRGRDTMPTAQPSKPTRPTRPRSRLA